MYVAEGGAAPRSPFLLLPATFALFKKYSLNVLSQNQFCRNLALLCVVKYGVCWYQGPTGRCIQLRDGSGSGIGKNFGFGFGYGSGSGISTAFLSIGYYRVLKILIGYFPDKVLSFGSTKVLAALEPLDPSTRLARIYVGFNAILGCCSRRAEQIKEAAQKSD